MGPVENEGPRRKGLGWKRNRPGRLAQACSLQCGERGLWSMLPGPCAAAARGGRQAEPGLAGTVEAVRAGLGGGVEGGPQEPWPPSEDSARLWAEFPL